MVKNRITIYSRIHTSFNNTRIRARALPIQQHKDSRQNLTSFSSKESGQSVTLHNFEESPSIDGFNVMFSRIHPTGARCLTFLSTSFGGAYFTRVYSSFAKHSYHPGNFFDKGHQRARYINVKKLSYAEANYVKVNHRIAIFSTDIHDMCCFRKTADSSSFGFTGR